MGSVQRRASVIPAVLAVLALGLATAPARAAEPTVASAGNVRIVAATAEDRAAEASAIVSRMSTAEKAASVVMGHISTTDPERLRRYMQDGALGGFILMGGNVPANEAALRTLTAALTIDPALPPLIAIDEEGGDVTRLPWDDLPGARTLKREKPAVTEDAFRARGALLQRAGIGVNFGIVADIPRSTSSFIHGRAFGLTPAPVAAHVGAAVAGELGQVLSTVKHFPGHGAAEGDSHAVIPTTGMSRAAWDATDAVPFRAAIDAGVPLIMYGHLTFRAIDTAPASLSTEWHRIAREDLGFRGVAITDDLGMLQATGIPAYRDLVRNAVTALQAGNDMVLAVMFTDGSSAGRIVEGIVAAVESGDLDAARLDEAATRVVALRLELAAGGRGLLPCADCAPVG